VTSLPAFRREEAGGRTPEADMEPLTRHRFVIHQLSERLAVVRMGSRDQVPAWALTGLISAVVRTPEELTIVCSQTAVPGALQSDLDWLAFRLEGSFPLSATGVLASVLGPLASGSIPVFVVSTFGTDYILVKADQARRAGEILEAEGHKVTG
jgi:hypothetical protein